MLFRSPARRRPQERGRKSRRAEAHRGTAMPRRAQESHGLPDPYGDEAYEVAAAYEGLIDGLQ